MRRNFRLSTLLLASASLLLLDACGGVDSGSPVELQSQLQSESQPQLQAQQSKLQHPFPVPQHPYSLRSVGPCPDFVLCILGTHWDSNRCRCVPNEDDAGACSAP
jgi:hypothetical protein